MVVIEQQFFRIVAVQMDISGFIVVLPSAVLEVAVEHAGNGRIAGAFDDLVRLFSVGDLFELFDSRLVGRDDKIRIVPCDRLAVRMRFRKNDGGLRRFDPDDLRRSDSVHSGSEHQNRSGEVLRETETLDTPIVVAANAHNVYRAKALRESLETLRCENTYMGMAIEVDRSRVLNVDKNNSNVIDSTEREADSAALSTVYATIENSHEVVGDVAGKEAIIVDNYSLTGDTLCRVAKVLKEQGARKITVVLSHGLFDEKAVEQLGKAPIERIISTNTVPACEAEKVRVDREGER